MAINRDFDADLPPLGINRTFGSPQPIPVGRLILERLTNPLDNSPDMNVDGSVTPVSFRASIPVGDPPILNGLLIAGSFYICDTLIEPTKFGGISALTNGCQLSIRDINDNIRVLPGSQAAISGPINYKTNTSWLTQVGPNFNFWDGGSQDDLFAWDYRFYDAGICFQLDPGDYVEMLIRDDLRNIEEFQGSIVARLIGK